VVAIALASVIVTLAPASANAYWLCLPGVLVAAALASTTQGAALAAATVAAATEVALVLVSSGPHPSLVLAVLVPAASVAVLVAVRLRFEHEREQLREAALSDPLTGVANRRSLLARAEYEIARHLREERSFALVMLDLDGFKALNDRFGHGAGDEILCDIAVALAAALRAQDTVARLGGDEFCVLAPETDRTGVGALAARIGGAVAGATTGVDALSATVGIALFPDDGRSVAELMEAADHRLLGGKRTRYGRVPRRAAA
jgi:diguanylate cyclase (GGDEF)-like protein